MPSNDWTRRRAASRGKTRWQASSCCSASSKQKTVGGDHNGAPVMLGRRHLLFSLAVSLAAPWTRGANAGRGARMSGHVVLLGDSIFDNDAYTGSEPDVVQHLRSMLPTGWSATLCAVDGARIADLPE